MQLREGPFVNNPFSYYLISEKLSKLIENDIKQIVNNMILSILDIKTL